MAGPLPVDFDATLAKIRDQIPHVSGWLTDREVHFLSVAAACPTTGGKVLELGCYHGKSTIVLAMAANLASRQQIYSVDPIDPAPLVANLRAAGVSEAVNFTQLHSQNYLRSWRQSIRMLWHDGSNRDQEVREDIQLAWPHLSDGAIVAFHDVLNTSGERIHPFVDEILGSGHFGPVGVCGSIGWGQFHVHQRTAFRYFGECKRLAAQLNRVRQYHWCHLDKQNRLSRYRYKLLRSMIPHSAIDATKWLADVTRRVETGHTAMPMRRAA